AALVAVAGPLTNLLIAFVAFGAGVLTGVITPYGFEAGLAGMVISTVVAVNLGFFVFNSLPLPPLDGSRVMYALAPEFVRRGMEVVERFGILFVFIIVLVASPLLFEFMSIAIGFFMDIFGVIFGLQG